MYTMARNEVIFPSKVKTNDCPKCGSDKYTGFMNEGIMKRKCKDCGNVVLGGIGQEPWDKNTAVMPELYQPPVQFVDKLKKNEAEVVEVRNHANKTPAYRTGTNIPGGRNE